MKNDTWEALRTILFAILLLMGAMWLFSTFIKGCEARGKEEKALALIDSIEKKLEKKDSTLREICDVFADGFINDKFYDESGNEYKSDTCYNEEGVNIGTPEDIAARCFEFLKERIEIDCYPELEEIRETYIDDD